MSDFAQFGLTASVVVALIGLPLLCDLFLVIIGVMMPAVLVSMVLAGASMGAYIFGLLGDAKLLGVFVAFSAIAHAIYNWHEYRGFEQGFRGTMAAVDSVCALAAIWALVVGDSGAVLWIVSIVVFTQNAVTAYRLYDNAEFSWS